MIADRVFGSEGNRVLITGSHNSGKTSLLFKLAYELAERGGSPLIICSKTKMESKMPLNVLANGRNEFSGSKMSSDVLCRIQMKYATSMAELKAIVAGLHGFTPTPTAILIDDFSSQIDPLHAVARSDPVFLDICFTIGAFLDDVTTFISNQMPTGSGTGTELTTKWDVYNVEFDSVNSDNVKVVITDSCEERAFISSMQNSLHISPLQLRANNSYNNGYCLVSTDSAHRVQTGTNNNSNNNTRGVRTILSNIELNQNALMVSV